MTRFEIGKKYEMIYNGEVEREVICTNVKYDTQRLVVEGVKGGRFVMKLRVDEFGNEFGIASYGGGKKGFIHATKEVA